MAIIRTVSIADAPYHYSTGEILAETASGLGSDPFFARVASGARIAQRRFAMPIDRLLSLGGQEERTAVFRTVGLSMAVESVTSAFTRLGLGPDECDSFVFTSCSAPVIPSLDADVIESGALHHGVRRVPLYQHGCVGGAAGMALASSLPGTSVVTALELCSLVFRPADGRSGNMVGSALFADGCATAVLCEEGPGLEILGHASRLVPGTTRLMGYELLDGGAHLLLDREIPSALAAALPASVTDFLAAHGLRPEEVPYWLPHPGGSRILDHLEDSFRWNDGAAKWSRDVLRDRGNMSSATILYVLERFLADPAVREGAPALVIGIGPGLYLQFMLLRVARGAA